MFKMLQKIGKAFMLPIAILPAAGLLLGIGGALSNPTTVATYPVLNNPVLQGVFTIMSAAGTVVFANLAMLLCVGLCIGLAKRDKGTAALAGVVGFLVMNATITSLLGIFNPDGAAIDTIPTVISIYRCIHCTGRSGWNILLWILNAPMRSCWFTSHDLSNVLVHRAWWC